MTPELRSWSSFPARLVLLLLLSAACVGRPEAEPNPAQEVEDTLIWVPTEEPRLSPADSAAAVAQQARDAEELTRRVMGEDYRPPPEPHVDTREKQYASCLVQGRGLEEPARTTVLEACERRFGSPAAP